MVSDRVAEAALRAVEANAELFRQYKGFADPVPTAADAPILDRLLAWSGRNPAWTPRRGLNVGGGSVWRSGRQDDRNAIHLRAGPAQGPGGQGVSSA